MRRPSPKRLITRSALLASLVALSFTTSLSAGTTQSESKAPLAHHTTSGTRGTISAARGYEDPRLRKLAEQLVNYSIGLQEGERILLFLRNDSSIPLAKAVIDEVYRVGGVPFVDMTDEQIRRALYLGATAEQYRLMFSWDSLKYASMDARILIDGVDNSSELSDVPVEKTNLQAKYWLEPLESKVMRFNPRWRWCYLRIPTSGMAQAAGMSDEAFNDFYYEVYTLDYERLSKAMQPLKRLMEATNEVRIVGTGTDLTFSIKNIPAEICDGHFNIPDGEIFTAPVKTSANGTLTINQPSTRLGVTYQDIRLEFKDGKIVRASANYTEELNQVLDIDEGARYLGEFAFGLNPYIEKPIGDVVFDEKISMSFHVAIGSSYQETDNGNHSAIHWDLVCIQSPEYGGGEIWFDGKLIRKDGLFAPQELAGLNPENLK